MSGTFSGWTLIIVVLVVVLIGLPLIVAGFLRNVDAGTIRLVSWLQGGTVN
jgi:flotillin